MPVVDALSLIAAPEIADVVLVVHDTAALMTVERYETCAPIIALVKVRSAAEIALDSTVPAPAAVIVYVDGPSVPDAVTHLKLRQSRVLSALEYTDIVDSGEL